MLFKATPLGFTFNLIQLAYSFVLATIRGEILHVYQASNSISPRIRIFEDVLEPHDRIRYIDTLDGDYGQEYDIAQDSSTISGALSKEKIRELICECLRFKVVAEAAPDAAVHCRGGDKVAWGEMDAVPIERYVAALADLPAGSSVFLMTDTGETVRKFREAGKGKGWNITTFVSETAAAYDQYTFNDKTAKQKLAEIKQLIRELSIAKAAARFVGTASSNVSLLIFLTRAAGSSGAISLDVPVDIFFN